MKWYSKKGGADNSKYFYASYKEKLETLPPSIYGLYYTNSEEGRIMRVASNRDSGMEYRITMTPEEGESYLVQDFAENKEFSVAPEECGKCKIEARLEGTQEKIGQTMEINY